MQEHNTYRLQDSLPVFDYGDPVSKLTQRKKNILVVEEEEDVHHALSCRLRDRGFEVTSCFDAQNSLQKTGFRRPDLVLLDLVHPGARGFELLAGFLQVERLCGVPVIVMTVFDDPFLREEAEKLGVHHLALKPLDSEALMAEVVEVLGDPTDHSSA